MVKVWACSIVAASNAPTRHFAQFCRKKYELSVLRSSRVTHLLDEKFWNFGFYSGKTRSSCLGPPQVEIFLVTKRKNDFFWKKRKNVQKNIFKNIRSCDEDLWVKNSSDWAENFRTYSIHCPLQHIQNAADSEISLHRRCPIATDFLRHSLLIPLAGKSYKLEHNSRKSASPRLNKLKTKIVLKNYFRIAMNKFWL
jgi:hypothetical protein